VTNTALYLLIYDVPLTLLKFELYRTDFGQLLLTTSQLLPVPDTEEVMVRPRSGVATRNAAQRNRKGNRLHSALLRRLEDGQPLTVIAPARVTKVDVHAIQAWLQADGQRSRALWLPADDPQHSVEWSYDGGRYSVKGFAQAVVLVLAATGEPDAPAWGYNWLRHDGDGKDLAYHAYLNRESGTDALRDDSEEEGSW
jgi:hypothetical protein